MVSLILFLSGIGGVSLAFLAVKILRFVKIYLRPSSLKRYQQPRGGNTPWALITGATEGIGLAYAQELAYKGFNIIIHGRNLAKLNTVKTTLSTESPKSEFRTIVIDALLEGLELSNQLDAAVQTIKGLHLTVLINNLGAPPPGLDPPFQLYEAMTPSHLDGLININLRFATQLTSRILPLFLEHKKPSLILNMGSMADPGFPYSAMYSGAKAFLLSWSTALSREMKIGGHDVEVMYIALMSVTDTSRNRDRERWGMPGARAFARACLERVGCGEFVVAGDWVQGVAKGVLEWLPEGLYVKVFLAGIEEVMEADRRMRKGV
jgi:17beta-estradiol 17-dehydrogenase / very-long-chain 3-oxoacyl-CoA reductase